MHERRRRGGMISLLQERISTGTVNGKLRTIVPGPVWLAEEQEVTTPPSDLLRLGACTKACVFKLDCTKDCRLCSGTKLS